MAGNSQREHIVGANKQELQYMLFHKLASDPVSLTAVKAQFYYNTVSDTMKVYDTSWKFIPKINSSFVDQQLIVGNSYTLQKANSPPEQTSYVKINTNSVVSLNAYIPFIDISEDAFTTTITAPGLNTLFVTEKAVVDYITSMTSGIQVNSDWNSISGVSEILNKPSLDFDKYEYWRLQGNTTIINYGALYNWWAANDARNIANVGWHLPSKVEHDTFIAYLGGNTVAGGKLKETGTTYWNAPSAGTNEVGFNARGNGERTTVGTFSNFKNYSFLWLSTEIVGNGYFFTALHNLNTTILNNNNKKVGYACRLVKDSTILTQGQTGTYTGNDGKIYRTVCIGTQEWLADNLNETKYRNGDLITVVTDNTAWSLLATEAMCYYNNLVANGYDVTSETINLHSKDKVTFKAGTTNLNITVQELSGTEAQITFYMNNTVPVGTVNAVTKGIWDTTITGTAISVPAYAAQGIGVFDNSVTNPTDITTGLNFNGVFRSSRLYEGATRVMTTHGAQVANGTLHSVVNTSHAGFCPQLPLLTGLNYFLRGDGTWASVSSFNYWQRVGTIISPVTAGDTVSVAHITLTSLATYADNAAALAGGLTAGQVYRTSTGILMITY